MTKMRSRFAAVLCTAALLTGGAVAAASAAGAVTNVTGVTYLPTNLDSGNGTAVVNTLAGGWALDKFHRTLTVTDSSACTVVVSPFTCFSATVSDTGTFTTIPGNGHAPNPASTTDPGTNIAWPPVSGPFSGTASYLFEANTAPAPSNIRGVVNNSGFPATGDNSTSLWFENAFSGGTAYKNADGTIFTGAIQNTWGWSYTSQTGASSTTTAVSCESWADTAANGAGGTALDGNITGKQCAGTPIPVPQGDLGNFVNPYGNGFDVYQQHYAVNTIVAGWTATKFDPATLFVRFLNSHGGFSLEAVNGHGIATGLCVSDPVGSEPAGFVPGQLTLRGCNNSQFQGFSPQPDGSLQSDVAGAGHVEPNGTGAPLVVKTTFDGWGGFKYQWKDRASLPG